MSKFSEKEEGSDDEDEEEDEEDGKGFVNVVGG